MPEKSVTVTETKRRESRLPDFFAEGAALVQYLSVRGFFDHVKERFKVDRSGGYAGVDAVLLLVYYFAAYAQVGLSRFDEVVGHHREKLAALGDRKRLPTQSSMSRLLGDVTQHDVHALRRWLLHEATEVDEVLRHPGVLSLDALGRPWHVVHYDPTKAVLRERALPEGGDLAPAHRRAATLTAPGHTGHKRGEGVVHRPSLQHAGSRLWLYASLAPGNGDQRGGLREACAAAVACVDRIEHPRSQTLFVADGEFGYVPSLTAIRASGMRMITRLNRLDLLDQEDVRCRMSTGSWYLVPDGCSGPQRSAMDLGVVTVRPGKETVQDDGTPYDPIEVRAVITRYPREGKAEHGRVIDGWQYELFAALDLEPDAWPAPDVITEYFHRGGQENGFAQEDRELQLDRTLSYNLAGQELAVLVGLAVWNLRVVLGHRMNPLPTKRAPAPRRVVKIDPRPFGTSDSSEDTTAANADPIPPSSAPHDEVPASPPAEPVTGESEASGATPSPKASIRAALSGLDWAKVLRHRPGWSYDPEELALRCAAGASLRLCGAYANNNGTARLVFHTTASDCRDCPLRGSCLASLNPDAVKQIAVVVPLEMAAAIREPLGLLQRDRRLHRFEKVHAAPPTSGRPRRPRVGEPLPVAPPNDEEQPGMWEISRGQLLPAAARAAFRAACRGLVVHVRVAAPRAERQHPYLVTSAGQRQHRRSTWTERQQRYALPDEAKVNVVFEGAGPISSILAPRRTADHHAA